LPVPPRFSRLKIVCGNLGTFPGAGTFVGGGVGWLLGLGVVIAYEVSAAASANPAVSITRDPSANASDSTMRLTFFAFSRRRSSSASARARSGGEEHRRAPAHVSYLPLLLRERIDAERVDPLLKRGHTIEDAEVVGRIASSVPYPIAIRLIRAKLGTC
jgi:hypothetical protein